MTLPLCENCGKPAVYTWLLEAGYEVNACGRCRPHSGVSARPIDAPRESVERPPLTVEQAAARERVSTRTVYRWITSGALADGAWKAGSTWRIDPAALDARRASPRPAKQPQRPRRRRRRTPTTGVAGGGWPK